MGTKLQTANGTGTSEDGKNNYDSISISNYKNKINIFKSER
jgi:hypothetical protein